MKSCLIFLAVVLSGCKATPQAMPLATVVAQYIEVFQKRQDFERLLTFYAPNAQLEDMIYGHVAADKKAIAKFYDWPNNKVEVLEGKALFCVSQKIIDTQQRVVIFTGQFHRFSYSGMELGPWRFLIKLQFNEQGKIIYQQDWINYTPRTLIDESKNLNTSHNS
ncbi:hypothetical protein PSECIP111951_00357 [Pseudoalteromonas holothuriae]|uniref:SnoaL-like domain-containing protein n=1 Tax=Pseudoalteromonas holothuriae TaxID=2963714 RepID=A0A9W4QQZ1_9GAMM|nr:MULTISPECIES: nuclear transport factor 2 family protein [unclassified Pseudoalteromonas]CAH9049606.1 hypothetical protein PSECIP111854_00251 [Pseudoalteromonas sp. CIP111854]CAH9051269.1 hypothetical protein PSECIP111951_00357 [Pseudoalteromonas sp. CIP111951]